MIFLIYFNCHYLSSLPQCVYLCLSQVMLLHREAELAVRSASCIKSNLILYSVFQKVSNVIYFDF